MKAMDNGALLALGVVGLAAVAGRVKRGSFSRSALLQQAEQIFDLSDSDEEVDSGQLTYVLYNASESDEVPVSLRHEADEILARSEQEEYLDTGEALELLGRIRDALRNAKDKGGSRSWDAQEQEEPDLSTEAVISDARGGGVDLSIEGRHIGTYKDDKPKPQAKSFQQAKGRRSTRSAMDNALAAFRAWCDKHSYYPSLYWISDHGNVHGPISPKTGKAYKRRGGSRAKSVQGKVGGGAMFLPPLKPGGPPRLGLANKPRVVQGKVGGGVMFLPPLRPGGPPRLGLANERRGGSRAVGVHANDPKNRAEYVRYLDDLADRAKAGKLTLDEDSRWSHGAETSPYDHHAVSRKVLNASILKNIAAERAWISTWSQRNPQGGSRAVYGMSAHDAGHVLRLGMGKPRRMAGEALNDYRWHPDRALAQHAASKGKKGRGGSRAFLLDDPEYTHYVVHVPSMKIASGWSYPEDAKEEISDNMGQAGKHCKVYTRKYLKDKGHDPRHNGNWASRGQF